MLLGAGVLVQCLTMGDSLELFEIEFVMKCGIWLWLWIVEKLLKDKTFYLLIILASVRIKLVYLKLLWSGRCLLIRVGVIVQRMHDLIVTNIVG